MLCKFLTLLCGAVEDEEVVDRKELRLQGEDLYVHQSDELRKCLEKWSEVLSDKPGMYIMISVLDIHHRFDQCHTKSQRDGESR